MPLLPKYFDFLMSRGSSFNIFVFYCIFRPLQFSFFLPKIYVVHLPYTSVHLSGPPLQHCQTAKMLPLVRDAGICLKLLAAVWNLLFFNLQDVFLIFIVYLYRCNSIDTWLCLDSWYTLRDTSL